MVRREKLPPIFNERLAYKNNPCYTQTTARARKDQNRLLFFCISLFGMEETASVSYTQI